MSILLPGNLSSPDISGRKGQKNEPPLLNSWFPPECEPDIGEWASNMDAGIKTNLSSEEECKNITSFTPSPYSSLGLDQYGTELAKEARVWKVYVKETDAWDAELVEGWNRRLCSQLSQLPNSSVPAQVNQPTNETQEFVPPCPLFLVNILWYLSLSLSIATSFLAILAKDWCHSFMAHRSGHPCIQARRRQQKWTMIEHWKMQEFIAILPLLIHIALLLFAIGLCIYVWDLNTTVALPIVFITGTVIAFYATSTIAATLLNSFPYITTVSRILGSELLKYLYAFVAMVFFLLTCYPTAILFDGLIVVGERWEKLSSKRFQRWVPEAVDIALQAIAGANARLPRKPLMDCGAHVALSRRIASGGPTLSYLGTNNSSESTGEIEAMVWDLQAENERNVSALIADGKFTPDDHNIAALRIDTMAPSQCLSLLKGNNQDGKDIFDPIVLLLRQHANQSHTLHPASRLALVNAATTLCACIPSSMVPDILAGLSMQIFYNDCGDEMSLGFCLIAIALLQGRPSGSHYPGVYSNVALLPAPRIFQMLLVHQSADREALKRFTWFGILEILSTPAQYNINISETKHEKNMTEARKRTSLILESLPLPANHNVAPRSAARLALPIIQSLDWVYTTCLVGVPEPNVYTFVVECMLCVLDNQVDKLCWSLMSTFRFPSLSTNLLKYLDERSLILVYQKHLDSDYAEMQFFAAAQLWLLFTLYLDPPVETTPELDLTKLLALLEQSSVIRNDGLNMHQAKEKLGERIEELEAEICWEEGPPMIYGLRVLECVLQSRDHPLSDQRWEKINSKLETTPRCLRGLGSFTPLPMRRPYALKEEHISIALRSDTPELQELTNV
ncbi:hypothetical protein RHS03_09835, partial [Rhizoctonia solani]